MPKKVRILLAVLVIFALGGGWFYLQRVRPQSTDMLTLYGNVDIREVQPAFNDSGHITAMLVQEGATVKRGDLLATLDDTRYAAALAQAKATMAAAKVTYLNDEVNYRRYASLTQTNAASEQQRDNAKAQFDAARASFEAAVAAVALAQREFDDTRLYAPSDGVIEDRILQPGDMASPSTPAYTMALPNPLWVRAYVPERDVGRMRLGQTATVNTDSYPGRSYRGWIGYLSPTAEFTPKTVETPELRTSLVYQIRVYVCDSRGELKMGMPATVHIDLNQPATTTRPSCGTINAAP
ncbi:MAG: efflux RND transporter periplasmic adaptor subunit [Alphaproteobacteria bacterium]|nr:efflux RND transporter periplasmic adaptor subunit [Alphaproteobacteria bacterium]